MSDDEIDNLRYELAATKAALVRATQMDIYEKLNKCVIYNDIISLSEDLYSKGISIQRTNSDKIILCLIDGNGKMSCSKLFEDFVPLTKYGRENELLPNRTLLNIIEFVRRNSNNNVIKLDPKTHEMNALYGSSLNRLAVNNVTEKLITQELKNAIKENDEVDMILRSLNEI